MLKKNKIEEVEETPEKSAVKVFWLDCQKCAYVTINVVFATLKKIPIRLNKECDDVYKERRINIQRNSTQNFTFHFHNILLCQFF